MSNIDPTKPTAGQATTQSVRDNFQAAATEIDANASDIAVNKADIVVNKADIVVLQPGGGGDFASFLDGLRDTGLSLRYNGSADDILINSAYVVGGNTTTDLPSDMDATQFAILNTRMYTNNTIGTQIIYGLNGANIYKQWVRHRISAIWNAWKLVVDGSQLNFSNGQMVTSLPTADPLVSGALWNNGGVVNVSA